MAKAANQKTDSEVHNEDRRAKIKEEAEVNAKRNADEQALANYRGPVNEGETRDDLLDRIRQMREEPVAAQQPRKPDLTEGQKTQLALEQEAGRAAVARVAAEEEARNKARAAQAAGEKK